MAEYILDPHDPLQRSEKTPEPSFFQTKRSLARRTISPPSGSRAHIHTPSGRGFGGRGSVSRAVDDSDTGRYRVGDSAYSSINIQHHTRAEPVRLLAELLCVEVGRGVLA